MRLWCSIASSLLLAACNPGVDNAAADSTQQSSGFFDCAAASDCVAVPEATCCPHGVNVAVNVAAVSRYDAAYACVTPPRVCPFFQVVDRRLPDCDLTTHQCVLVEPPDDQP